MKEFGFRSGWVVGFLEGEGSFYCGNQKSWLMVSAEQVQEWPLRMLEQYCGGTVRFRRRPARDEAGRSRKASEIFVWTLGGEPAAILMAEIRPYMSPRRQEQIDKALDGWRDRPRTPRAVSGLGKPRGWGLSRSARSKSEQLA